MKPALSIEAALPYGRQAIEEDDLDAVREALLAPMLTTGPLVERFEAALAAETGAAHAVVCNSGTAALHLALRALRLGPGQCAIVPSVTFVATANAARYCGAGVVFADVDPETGLITPETLTDALRRCAWEPRVVLPVHLNGRSCDMAGIAAVARKWGLWIVEDACHALGGSQGGAPVGGCAASDMACFSFHPVKSIAMGEGGAITTNDPALAAAMRRDRSHGLIRDAGAFELDASFEDGDPAPWAYELQEPGFNYRAPDVLCALGLSQLRKLKRFVAQRRRLAALYDDALARVGPRARPPADGARDESAWHLYAARFAFADGMPKRGAVMRRLAARGIGTQVHYAPVHRQPYYARLDPGLDLPGADAYAASCLSLPLFAAMTERDVDRVVSEVAAALD